MRTRTIAKPRSPKVLVRKVTTREVRPRDERLAALLRLSKPAMSRMAPRPHA
jgi:hypothetical protein